MITVHGEVITDSQIENAIRGLGAEFTCAQLQRELHGQGVNEAMRAADRILQKAKREGYIYYAPDRKVWRKPQTKIDQVHDLLDSMPEKPKKEQHMNIEDTNRLIANTAALSGALAQAGGNPEGVLGRDEVQELLRTLAVNNIELRAVYSGEPA